MPFKKGVCTNPKGRGTSDADYYRRLAKQLLGPHFKVACEMIRKDLTSKKAASRQWAVKMVFDYTVGKPQQAVELTGENGGPLIAVIRDA